MILPPAPFNLEDVVTCGQLVLVAYDQYCQWELAGKPSPDSFSWTPNFPADFAVSSVSGVIWAEVKALVIFDRSEPFGFVVQDSAGRTFVVMRGTESDVDWYKDIEIVQKPYTLAPGFGMVHDGFISIYSTMSEAVLNAIDSVKTSMTSLFFTGHSLGSSLITLAVPDVMVNAGISVDAMHYNFASPRTGDEEFANALDSLAGVTTYRIVNTEDLVPDVPLAVSSDVLKTYLYKHAGTPVDFTAQYDSIGGNHSMANSYAYAVNNPAQPEGPVVAASACTRASLPHGLLKTR